MQNRNLADTVRGGNDSQSKYTRRERVKLCDIVIHNNAGQSGKDEPCRLVHNDAVVSVVFFEPFVEPYNVYENRRNTQQDGTEEYVCSYCQVSVSNC